MRKNEISLLLEKLNKISLTFRTHTERRKALKDMKGVRNEE